MHEMNSIGDRSHLSLADALRSHDHIGWMHPKNSIYAKWFTWFVKEMDIYKGGFLFGWQCRPVEALQQNDECIYCQQRWRRDIEEDT